MKYLLLDQVDSITLKKSHVERRQLVAEIKNKVQTKQDFQRRENYVDQKIEANMKYFTNCTIEKVIQDIKKIKQREIEKHIWQVRNLDA